MGIHVPNQPQKHVEDDGFPVDFPVNPGKTATKKLNNDVAGLQTASQLSTYTLHILDYHR